MARKPKLPPGAGIYADRNLWRARLGKKFTGGEEKLRSFTSYQEAVDWIRDEEEKKEKHHEDAGKLNLTHGQLSDAFEALKKLAGMATLQQAADAWLKYIKPFLSVPSVEEGIEKLVAIKTEENHSDRHLRELKAKLTRFFSAVDAMQLSLSDLTGEHIRAALRAPMAGKTGPVNPSVQQRTKRLRYASILVNYAVQNGWIDPARNPMKGIVPPKHKRRANEEAPREFFKIFTPIQTAKLLWAAHEHCPELVAGLAIKIFSGVRNTELYTLTWENIHLEKERDSQIIVLAAFSKTGRKRAISIHPTLYQWLSPRVCNPEDRVFGMASHVKDRESVWLDAIKLSRKFAGIDPWPQNALRHGFGSYHYALYKNETLTASEVGDSTGVVRRHYIDAVRAKACGIFWSLTPANVEAFVTSDTETKEPILEEPEPEPDPPEEEFAGQQVSCLPCLKNVEI